MKLPRLLIAAAGLFGVIKAIPAADEDPQGNVGLASKDGPLDLALFSKNEAGENGDDPLLLPFYPCVPCEAKVRDCKNKCTGCSEQSCRCKVGRDSPTCLDKCKPRFPNCQRQTLVDRDSFKDLPMAPDDEIDNGVTMRPPPRALCLGCKVAFDRCQKGECVGDGCQHWCRCSVSTTNPKCVTRCGFPECPRQAEATEDTYEDPLPMVPRNNNVNNIVMPPPPINFCTVCLATFIKCQRGGCVGDGCDHWCRCAVSREMPQCVKRCKYPTCPRG